VTRPSAHAAIGGPGPPHPFQGVPVRASGGEVIGAVEHAGGSLHDWFGRTFGRGH